MVRAGGVVVKNVQGYDLVRPFVGSFGLLGEALEVVFRLRPGRAFSFLRRPWEGGFPRLTPSPRFLFALREGEVAWLYAFHFGHEREVARFREAFGGEEVGPLDLRSLFPSGMGVGEGPLWDLRFSWKDGGERPPRPRGLPPVGGSPLIPPHAGLGQLGGAQGGDGRDKGIL